MVNYVNVYNLVLFVSIDYKVPRGGIASVLNTYSTFIAPYKFVRTTAGELKTWQKLWYAVSGYILLVWELLTDRDIKIVHVHSASGTSFWRKSYVIKISKALGKKVIFHCHGGGFKEFRATAPEKVDRILAKCDAIVCLSKEWEAFFRSIDCPNVYPINNVIPQPQYEEVVNDGKVHFLFLGLVCKNKGIFDLVESINEHRSELENRIILHVGGNGETDKLCTYIKDNHLEKIIRFEGWVDKEKKTKLLNISDVYILPSYIEGVPISILEAESYKLPVITTNVGGIPSIVKDKKTGLFVTPGNKSEIFNAISMLMNNPLLRSSLGEKGYEISKLYLPDTISKQLVDMYNKLLIEK